MARDGGRKLTHHIQRREGTRRRMCQIAICFSTGPEEHCTPSDRSQGTWCD